MFWFCCGMCCFFVVCSGFVLFFLCGLVAVCEGGIGVVCLCCFVVLSHVCSVVLWCVLGVFFRDMLKTHNRHNTRNIHTGNNAYITYTTRSPTHTTVRTRNTAHKQYQQTACNILVTHKRHTYEGIPRAQPSVVRILAHVNIVHEAAQCSDAA